MATDDERREMAEGLRMTTSNVRLAYGPSVLRALGLQSAGHESGDFYTLGSVDRLADLIDPPAKLYDSPDGSNKEADEDLKPVVDRDAVLNVAESMDSYAGLMVELGVDTVPEVLLGFVRLIREACGEAVA